MGVDEDMVTPFPGSMPDVKSRYRPKAATLMDKMDTLFFMRSSVFLGYHSASVFQSYLSRVPLPNYFRFK